MTKQNIQFIIDWKDKISWQLEKIKTNIASIGESFSLAWAIINWTFFAWLNASINKAIDFQETTSKFWVVYSDIKEKATWMMKSLVEGYVMSEWQSKQFLADIGDMFAAFQLSQEAALDLSTEIVKMWADMAWFQNLAWWTTEAVDRLTKWLMGEHENLKALWVVINETILSQELMAKWKDKLTWMELEQAKIFARWDLVVKQSQNSIWDTARNIDSLATKKRMLNVQIEEITRRIWESLLPVFENIMNAISPIVMSITDWIWKNQELTWKILMITWWLLLLSITIWPIIWLLKTVWSVFWLVSTWLSILTTWFKIFDLTVKTSFIWIIISAIWILILLLTTFKWTFSEWVFWKIFWFFWGFSWIIWGFIWIIDELTWKIKGLFHFFTLWLFKWWEVNAKINTFSSVWNIQTLSPESIVWNSWYNKNINNENNYNININNPNFKNEQDQDEIIRKMQEEMKKGQLAYNNWIYV